MFVRQCLTCGVIDGRHTFGDEADAEVADGWRCEHCGGETFEVVVMVEGEATAEPDDVFE